MVHGELTGSVGFGAAVAEGFVSSYNPRAHAGFDDRLSFVVEYCAGYSPLRGLAAGLALEQRG